MPEVWMVVSAYSRLPSQIPIWPEFFGLPAVLVEKPFLLWAYPLTQTFVFGFFVLSARKGIGRTFLGKRTNGLLGDDQKNILGELRKGYLYLTLIFINLVFIHIQRTIILMAHQRVAGTGKYYLSVVLAVIVMLIPYYRLRMMLIRRQRGS